MKMRTELLANKNFTSWAHLSAQEELIRPGEFQSLLDSAVQKNYILLGYPCLQLEKLRFGTEVISSTTLGHSHGLNTHSSKLQAAPVAIIG